MTTRIFEPFERKLIHYRAAYKSNMCKYADTVCPYDVDGLCYYAHSKEELKQECCIDFYFNKKCYKHNCKRAHRDELYDLPHALLKKVEVDFNTELNKIESLTRENKELHEDISELKKKRRRIEDDLQEEIHHSKRKREDHAKQLNNLREDHKKEMDRLQSEINFLRMQLQIVYSQPQHHHQQPPHNMMYPPKF